MKNSRFRLPILVLLLAGAAFFLYRVKNDPWQRKRELESPQSMGALAAAPNTLKDWPPKQGERFPEVALFDHTGAPFSLDRLRGKPTLIEIVAMTCAGCQAYSGGNRVGAFGGCRAQDGLLSIEEYYRDYTGGLDLFDGKVNFVQILIYDLKLQPVDAPGLSAWRTHFRFDRKPNTHVVSGGKALANKDTFRMIPGFLLLDRDLVVHYDATGHTPRHNLYTELLPAVRRLITP